MRESEGLARRVDVGEITSEGNTGCRPDQIAEVDQIVSGRSELGSPPNIVQCPHCWLSLPDLSRSVKQLTTNLSHEFARWRLEAPGRTHTKDLAEFGRWRGQPEAKCARPLPLPSSSTS
jgi:hypothetical protein